MFLLFKNKVLNEFWGEKPHSKATTLRLASLVYFLTWVASYCPLPWAAHVSHSKLRYNGRAVF